MPNRYDDRDERNRGELSGGGGVGPRPVGPRNRADNPNDFFNEHANLGGNYARDPHRGGYGDDYARERVWRERNEPPVSHRGRGPKNWKRSDESIREEIHHRMTEHHELDASDIDVNVNESEVTLQGSVSDRHAKRLAEDICHDCRGVRDVHNKLKALDREVHLGKASE